MSRSPTPTSRVIQPLRDFLATEAAGGVVLLAATVVALVWANSPWKSSYAELWTTELTIGVGGHDLSMDLQHWVNDGLMTLFFFVVGLEIKRELVNGELRDPRAAALPAISAVGGMVVPAALYLALNRSTDTLDGWGIPMATDIAMAVGVLSLFSRRIHPSLKLFLLALAIVDDIGAIIVIAIVYSAGIELVWLAVGVGLVVAMVGLRAAGVMWIGPYVVLGVALWFAVEESGVHATIAGVVLGLLTPVRQSVAIVERLEHVLHRWTSLLIVPLFALANAGVVISGGALGDALSSRVTQGIVLGLVVGKLVGISSFAWVAHRIGLAVLPAGATWRGLVAVAGIAGIGFTVSLFVASLAFDGSTLDEAKIGILAASVLAAAVGGTLVLRLPRQEVRADG